MEYEIHERILLYLYELRHKDESYDLLKKFSDVNETLLRDTAEHLRKEGLIDVEYPFLGFGSVDFNTGQVDFPYAEKEDYVKAKIKTPGIEYVKQNLLKKTDTLDKLYKIIAIGGVICTVVIGAITLSRESKYREANQLNKDLQSSIDSIKQVQRASENDRDSLLKTRDKKIELLTSKIDSLTFELKVKKEGAKVAPMQRPH
jgi:hypothetical protein